MVTEEYTKYLASEDWDQKRRQRIAINNGKCAVCGSTRGLQVHHLTYKHLYDEKMIELLPLCPEHHARADIIRKSGLINDSSHPAYLITETIRLINSNVLDASTAEIERLSPTHGKTRAKKMLLEEKWLLAGLQGSRSDFRAILGQKLGLTMVKYGRTFASMRSIAMNLYEHHGFEGSKRKGHHAVRASTPVVDKFTKNHQAREMLMAQAWFVEALRGDRDAFKRALRCNVSRNGLSYGKSWASISSIAMAVYDRHGVSGLRSAAGVLHKDIPV